jgi:F0F1-type ATP synthase assembly protein I
MNISKAFNAFNARRKAISEGSNEERLYFGSYFVGFVILVLHVLCIVFEVPKLNETKNTYIAPGASEKDIMEVKRKDEEDIKNKKNYTISIIAISSIMIFLILGGAVNAKFFHSDSSGIIYRVFVGIGVVGLIINVVLVWLKDNLYPNL